MRQLFTLCFVLVFQMFAIGQTDVATSEASPSFKEQMKSEIQDVISHHLTDSHDFTFLSDKEGNYYGFSLPVILVDNGLKIFSSSKFEHGTKVHEVDGNFYKEYHGQIYKTDAEGTIHYSEAGYPTNEKPLDLSITKNVTMMLVTGLLMLLIFTSLAKSYAKTGGVPKGVGRFFEPIVLYIKDEIAIPNIGEKSYKKYMPFLLTVFFFIWILNVFGITPLGVNVTGNIAVTTALAIIVFVITNLTGKKPIGCTYLTL